MQIVVILTKSDVNILQNSPLLPISSTPCWARRRPNARLLLVLFPGNNQSDSLIHFSTSSHRRDICLIFASSYCRFMFPISSTSIIIDDGLCLWRHSYGGGMTSFTLQNFMLRPQIFWWIEHTHVRKLGKWLDYNKPGENVKDLAVFEW